MFKYFKYRSARKRLKIFLDPKPDGFITFNDLAKIIKLPTMDCDNLIMEQVKSENLFQYVKLHDNLYNSILDIPRYFTNMDDVSVVYLTNKIE